MRFPNEIGAFFRAGYRILFGLLPAPFRETHAPAMAAMLADGHREARARAGRLAEWLLFAREGKDLIATSLRLRKTEAGRDGNASAPRSDGPLRTLGRDIRDAARSLARRPAVPAVIVATLALAIGATTAIYGVLDAALLRPLPYDRPGELVSVSAAVYHSDGTRHAAPFSYPKLAVFREHAGEYAGITGYASRGYNLTGVDRPRRLSVELVSPSYFTVLGTPPRLGRLFVPADSVPGRAVAVLSDGMWRATFAADSAIIGRTIHLDGHALTVVGVAPASFRGLSGTIDLWVPLQMSTVLDYPQALEEAHNHWIAVVARRPPGMTMSQAAAVADRAGLAVAAVYPPGKGPPAGATIEPLDALRTGPALGRSLWILLAGITGILLIACSNIAGLLLARAEARRQAFTIRLAIGASRARLIRQLLIESLLLSLAGGIAGVALAAGVIRGLAALAPTALRGIATDLFSFETVRLDIRILAFAGALTLLSGLAFGLLPAFRASGQSIAGLLGGSRATAGRPGRFRPGRWLIAGQVMAAVVLLVGAGLLLKSFHRLQGQPLGFEPDGLVTFRLQPVYDNTREEAPRFNAALVDRLASIPGVRGVTLATCTPFNGPCSSSIVREVDGRELPNDQAPAIGVHYVGPKYFETMGIPVLAGRDFSRRDEVGAPHVVIVNRLAADRLWPGESPVGKRLSVYVGYFRAGDAEVIGVADDVRFGAPSDPPTPDVFIPTLQGGFSWTIVLVRTEATVTTVIPAVRSAVAELNSDTPLYDVRTMTERLGDAVARPRYAALLLASFAGVALLLAATGLYGVLAFRVGRQRHEFGVRMALGAKPENILRRVIGEALLVTAVGLGAGLVAAVVTSRVLQSLLYGVERGDPWILITVPALLVGVNLIAAFLPALRATRVDPMSVLRSE